MELQIKLKKKENIVVKSKEITNKRLDVTSKKKGTIDVFKAKRQHEV